MGSLRQISQNIWSLLAYGSRVHSHLGAETPLILRSPSGERRVKVLGLLGQGMDGRVYGVESSGKAAALKVSYLHKRNSLINEADIYGKARHPHLLQLYDFGDINWIAGAMLLEKAQGTLASLSEPQQKGMVLRGIFKGLEYLHSLGISHNDLGAKNIFYTIEHGRLVGKIGDLSDAHQGNQSSVLERMKDRARWLSHYEKIVSPADEALFLRGRPFIF